MAPSPNDRLRQHREATPSPAHPQRPLSRSELAELIVAYVWDHYGIETPVDRKYVAKLEDGKIRWPNERYRRALRTIFHTDDASLGFTNARAVPAPPAAEHVNHPWTYEGALDAITAVTEDPMDRRTLIQITGGALAGLALDWVAALPVIDTERPFGRAINEDAIVSFETIADELRRTDDRVGSGTVLPMAQAQLAMVNRLLREGRYTDTVRRRLLSCAAELLRFCGWLSWDDGHHYAAHQYWSAGLRAAHNAGDNEIGANILSFASYQATELGRPDIGMRLGAAAQLRLANTNRVTAFAGFGYANAAGAAGAQRDCRHALDTAVAAAATTETNPSWAYWIDGAHIDEMYGRTLLGLGDTNSAIAHLESYVNASEGRERARGQIFLAQGYVDAGHPEAAADTIVSAVDLLDGAVTSTRCTGKIGQLRADLARYDTAAVTALDERLHHRT